MVARLVGRCRSIDLTITPLLTKRASCMAPGDQNLIVSRARCRYSYGGYKEGDGTHDLLELELMPVGRRWLQTRQK